MKKGRLKSFQTTFCRKFIPYKIIPKTNTYRRYQYKKQTQGCRYEKVLGKLQKEFTITG